MSIIESWLRRRNKGDRENDDNLVVGQTIPLSRLQKQDRMDITFVMSVFEGDEDSREFKLRSLGELKKRDEDIIGDNILVELVSEDPTVSFFRLMHPTTIVQITGFTQNQSNS